jgi:hypothetical protein
MRIGLEDKHGEKAPEENMQTIGQSDDASFFDIPTSLEGATKEQSRLNFCLRQVTVAWSLDRVLCELRLISILVGNTVSALKIGKGSKPGTVKFHRLADDEWWDIYDQSRVPRTSSFS